MVICKNIITTHFTKIQNYICYMKIEFYFVKGKKGKREKMSLSHNQF